MSNRVYLSPPHMGIEEQQFINSAFESNWIAPLGPNVDGFEEDICAYTGAKHCTALSSGTAAIHLALVLLGIQPKDEVLVSTFTFSASVNPIVYLGGVPVFVESEKDTWNMCPKHLKVAIENRIAQGKKPKAIVLVHLYGMPSKMEEIMEVANAYGIPIIEDAAEAIGSSYKKKQMGTWGKIGVFSFNGNKIITTSGGGALVANEKLLTDKAVFLSTQARDAAPHYQHSEIGYNYRMSNVLAGIGRGQMMKLASFISKRQEHNAFYQKELAEIKQIKFQTAPDSAYESNCWLSAMYILEDDGSIRNKIMEALNAQNIESRPLWKPMHLQPVFKDYPYYGDQLSETLFQSGICLPSGSQLTDVERKTIVEIIKKVLAN